MPVLPLQKQWLRAPGKSRNTAAPPAPKTVEMKELAPVRLRERRRRWAQQGSPNESEKESLRPQPLGCKKTAIYGRARESVQSGSQLASFGRSEFFRVWA